VLHCIQWYPFASFPLQLVICILFVYTGPNIWLHYLQAHQCIKTFHWKCITSSTPEAYCTKKWPKHGWKYYQYKIFGQGNKKRHLINPNLRWDEQQHKVESTTLWQNFHTQWQRELEISISSVGTKYQWWWRELLVPIPHALPCKMMLWCSPTASDNPVLSYFPHRSSARAWHPCI